MTQKTWFLPPSFNFFPEGELALGTVLGDPSKPTWSLVSLLDHPDIVLPEPDISIEKGHTHSYVSKRSVTAKLFAKIVNLFSLSASIDTSSHRDRSFGTVDLEARVFGRKISEEALGKITSLGKVKSYIEGGWYGKRPVYIISGLLVAKDSFQVKDTVGSAGSRSATASAGTGSAEAPLQAGASTSASSERTAVDGHQTAPGVIYAYRLHVIRTARDGDANTELFAERTAFLSGEGEDEAEEKMECTEVTARIVDEDLELKLEYDETMVEESELSVVCFK